METEFIREPAIATKVPWNKGKMIGSKPPLRIKDVWSIRTNRLQAGGPEALEDKVPRPKHVWNRIPAAIRERIVQLALAEPELSPRELATRFTDTAGYFVSEASVYRLLKALDLIASPAYIVMKAADEFKDKTTAPSGRDDQGYGTIPAMVGERIS